MTINVTSVFRAARIIALAVLNFAPSNLKMKAQKA